MGTAEKKKGVSDDTASLSSSATRTKGSLTCKKKALVACRTTVLILLLPTALYFFLCSIQLMSDAFTLLGGSAIADMFQNSVVLRSPLANLMIGIVITAVLQNDTTVATICIAMVNAKALTVQQAYYVVMGVNVGTAVTSTMIALFVSKEHAEFSRAFSAAIIHDLYNWLGVVVLFPIEWATAASFGQGFIVWLSGLMVYAIQPSTIAHVPYLSEITEPFTDLIFQLDQAVIDNITLGIPTNQSFTKHICDNRDDPYWCGFLLNVNLPDQAIGGILVTLSLVCLVTCLGGMVKVLYVLLGGRVRHVLQRSLNFELQGRWRSLTGYMCMLIGLLVTVVVQSSAMVCTTLIPLVGMGLISLERFWVYEIGADVGTTGTAIFAALATKSVTAPLQLALCNSTFNFVSIFLFYSVPTLRRLTLRASVFIGDVSARYRWFALLYILVTFILLPGLFLGLNFISWIACVVVLLLMVVVVVAIVVVNLLQSRRPDKLPQRLRSWLFLPEPLRSLEPYDRLIRRSCCHGQRRRRQRPDNVYPVEVAVVKLVHYRPLFGHAPWVTEEKCAKMPSS